MKLIDLLSREGEGHVFSEAEIDQCRTKGDCVQCGLCCIGYPTPDLPAVKPWFRWSRVPGYDKKNFEPCIHLKKTDDGRFACACHDVKRHPKLEKCRTWRGDAPSSVKDINQYDAGGTNFLHWLGRIEDTDDLLAADILLRRGIVRIATGITLILPRSELNRLLLLALKLPELPLKLLQELPVRTILAATSPEKLAELKRFLNLDRENLKPNERQFLDEFFPTAERGVI